MTLGAVPPFPCPSPCPCPVVKASSSPVSSPASQSTDKGPGPLLPWRVHIMELVGGNEVDDGQAVGQRHLDVLGREADAAGGHSTGNGRQAMTAVAHNEAGGCASVVPDASTDTSAAHSVRGTVSSNASHNTATATATADSAWHSGHIAAMSVAGATLQSHLAAGRKGSCRLVDSLAEIVEEVDALMGPGHRHRHESLIDAVAGVVQHLPSLVARPGLAGLAGLSGLPAAGDRVAVRVLGQEEYRCAPSPGDLPTRPGIDQLGAAYGSLLVGHRGGLRPDLAGLEATHQRLVVRRLAQRPVEGPGRRRPVPPQPHHRRLHPRLWLEAPLRSHFPGTGSGTGTGAVAVRLEGVLGPGSGSLWQPGNSSLPVRGILRQAAGGQLV